MLAGQTIVGNSVSFTVTVNVQVDWFPDESVAVQVTVVFPTGNTLPEGGEQEMTGAGSVSSIAVVVNVTEASHCPGVLFTVRLGGQDMTGFVVSVTAVAQAALPSKTWTSSRSSSTTATSPFAKRVRSSGSSKLPSL